MRLAPRIIIPAALFMLLIGYQNFSIPKYIPSQKTETPKDWDHEATLQVIKEMHQFQKTDPGLPQELAVPQGGSDFESVRNNWVERQGKLLLNGFDKKIENAVNDKINAFVQSWISSDQEQEKAAVEGTSDQASTHSNSQAPSPSRTQASASPNVSGQGPVQAPTPISNTIAGQITGNGSYSEPQKKPRHILKFPRPNMVKYEVGSDASVNLIANPGETLVNYSQAYNERTRLGIEHSTNSNKTQMFFRYDW